MTNCNATLAVEAPPATSQLSLAGRLLRWSALRMHRRSAFHRGEGLERTSDASAYDAWRAESLRQQLTTHFDVRRLRGKDVLDFGCGTGELTIELVRAFGSRQVIGVDLSRSSLDRAIGKLGSLDPDLWRSIGFLHARSDRNIDIPDGSIDIVCCFDVVEHIPRIDETLAEWHRVLRPGGEVWIWWSPWRGPYGHHLESLIPLPWFHLVFRPETIFAVCAHLYDDPAFRPRVWDVDPISGKKKPNKWHEVRQFEPFLNRLTRHQLERAIRSSGLRVIQRQSHGFGGSRLSRATRPFRWLPVLGECLVSFFTYQLGKQ